MTESIVISARVMEAVRAQQLTPSSAILHGQITSLTGFNIYTAPPIERLSELTGLSRRTIYRAMDLLEDVGFLYKFAIPGDPSALIPVDVPGYWEDDWGPKPKPARKDGSDNE